MDVLSLLALEIRCPSCGQVYTVSIANIQMSQQMLNEGCSCRGESECPPLFLSNLVKEEDLTELARLLQRIGNQLAFAGGKLIPSRSPGGD